MCYDREASKAFGADAVLNFPPGCNPNTPTTHEQSQTPVLPAGGGHGHDGPAPNGLVPAGSADGNPVPYSGPEVRPIHCLAEKPLLDVVVHHILKPWGVCPWYLSPRLFWLLPSFINQDGSTI
jgi:hypothetical protein